jgi:RNA polymerase sigma-70 factor (ECF subfamily)
MGEEGMNALQMTLAMQTQIGDNIPRDTLDFLWDVAEVMTQEDRKSRVWGTDDKVRLADLVERGRKGDLKATEDLYEIFKRPIFNLAYRHTLNPAAAEDLLQDIFLKVFTHLRDVRDLETFPGWVYRIALNTCYSHLRQKRILDEKVVPLGDVEGWTADPGSDPVERDLKAPLDKAIQGLPNRLKSVFILHDVQGFKHREISKILKCSIGTSKSQLFKARMKLREVLRAKEFV